MSNNVFSKCSIAAMVAGFDAQAVRLTSGPTWTGYHVRNRIGNWFGCNVDNFEDEESIKLRHTRFEKRKEVFIEGIIALQKELGLPDQHKEDLQGLSNQCLKEDLNTLVAYLLEDCSNSDVLNDRWEDIQKDPYGSIKAFLAELQIRNAIRKVEMKGTIKKNEKKRIEQMIDQLDKPEQEPLLIFWGSVKSRISEDRSLEEESLQKVLVSLEQNNYSEDKQKQMVIELIKELQKESDDSELQGQSLETLNYYLEDLVEWMLEESDDPLLKGRWKYIKNLPHDSSDKQHFTAPVA